MPRPARVGYDIIFDVLKDLPIFNENGVLKKQNDPVWKKAGRILKDMSVHNLYIFVYQDRKNIKTNLMKYLNIECKQLLSKKIKKSDPCESSWDKFEYFSIRDKKEKKSEEAKEPSPSQLKMLLSMINKEYKSIIKKFTILPFTLIYWHAEQIAVWKNLINLEPTVSLIVLNNIVSQISEAYESGNIYVYALTVEIKNTVILLAQMMSDSIDSLDIKYFFNTWLQNGAPAPPKLVIGYSYNLLDAASLAFNVCTFYDYNLRCYNYLSNKTLNFPPTLIKIDILGLIKVIDGWMCFKDVLQPVKDLYLCSIMYLSEIENIDEFRETVVSVLILCQSPYLNSEGEARKTTLWENLISDTIQQMNQKYIQSILGKNGSRSFSFLNSRQNLIYKSSNEIYNYINELKLQALKLCDFDTDTDKLENDYYCPHILENLIQLFTEFPSWTSIIVKKNENSSLVTTSSLKHLSTLYEVEEPIGPSEFLINHLEKAKTLSKQGEVYFSSSIKNKNNFICIEQPNNHSHLLPSTSMEGYDNRIEITIPSVEENQDIVESEELDLTVFKATIYSSINSLMEFDDYIEKILSLELKSEQEMAICRTLLDCCTEMNVYEKYIGIIASKLCQSSDVYADYFKEILVDCYNTVELFNKNELVNSSKLLAHLLISNSIPWEILSNIKLNERDVTTNKLNFIKIFLQDISEHMGISRLLEKFQDPTYGSAFKGLFPIQDLNDTQFAITFLKSIGLQALCNLLKRNQNKYGEPSTSISSSSSSAEIVGEVDFSSDVVIEFRISKDTLNSKKKIVLIK